MKKSRSTSELKVKNSSRYARHMDRSFAVIYHNLKRIQDEKQPQEEPRRRHSEPIGNLALLQNLDETTPKQRGNESTETTASSGPQQRRVSFSGRIIHTFSQTIPISSSSRPAEYVHDLPETDNDKDSTRKESF